MDVLGQRQQCCRRAEKHRENRRSAGYITRPCQSRRSFWQAPGRLTIPSHHVRTPHWQCPCGSCFGFGDCASPEQRHFLSRLLCQQCAKVWHRSLSRSVLGRFTLQQLWQRYREPSLDCQLRYLYVYWQLQFSREIVLILSQQSAFISRSKTRL